jgi:glyoxylase-like metal-dependent hydrolase (beta-lactamase superfamily II)
MAIDLPCYEVFAIRYAWVDKPRGTNFMSCDHHDRNMPMDYFVWLIRNEERIVLVDTGFNATAARERKRNFLRSPLDGLALLGIQPGQVTEVALTHLHYDHAGNIDLLPGARLHVQEKEMHYATGKYMNHHALRHAYTVDDVIDVLRGVYEDRVIFHDGDDTLHPGIELLFIGGHTMGLQAVRVHTRRGWVVLASDASHYYENMDTQSPFPIVFNVGDMLAGYGKLRRAADSAAHIVPGHDPEVMRRYPAWGAADQGIVALHESPLP